MDKPKFILHKTKTNILYKAANRTATLLVKFNNPKRVGLNKAHLALLVELGIGYELVGSDWITIETV